MNRRGVVDLQPDSVRADRHDHGHAGAAGHHGRRQSDRRCRLGLGRRRLPPLAPPTQPLRLVPAPLAVGRHRFAATPPPLQLSPRLVGCPSLLIELPPHAAHCRARATRVLDALWRTGTNAVKLGPLPDKAAATFAGGRYATIRLERPLTVYRAWHEGGAREFGGFWSLERPQGSLQTRIDSALRPEWG